MAKSRLYLLSGNGSNASWWSDALPYFETFEPHPLELPGSGSNTSGEYNSLKELAESLIGLTAEGNEILACGINALPVLHALVLKPGHFSKVTLLAPVGAFLWKRKLAKRMQLRPLRKIARYLLSNHPRLFRDKFSHKEWSAGQYKKMGEGYRQSRAFEKYFDIVKPHNALGLFEWIEAPIEIIWGGKDRLVEIENLPAWDSILPRAELTITIKDDWGHYPYIDEPEEFVKHIESRVKGFLSHTKSGRLKLARLAGLDVPGFVTLSYGDNTEDKIKSLPPGKLYAVRSSHSVEDKIDSSKAGLFETKLKVKKEDVPAAAKELFAKGIDELIVQQFIEPEVSGVAFVRNISSEIEWVHGHLENMVSGRVKPYRSVISKMKGGWQKNWNLYVEDTPFVLLLSELDDYLKKVIEAFHYQHCDIEWAWDREKFYILQVRPVTSYSWHRLITAANIDEILPKQVSRLMEHAQRRAANSIGKIYGIFDSRNIEDNEPFSAVFDDASYINSDLFLSRFNDWGLPGRLYFKEIGGAAPEVKFKLSRFIKSLPLFAKMVFSFRREILKSGARFKDFEKDFNDIVSSYKTGAEQEERLAGWFVRFYVFIVQTNIIIKALIATANGGFLGKPETVYKDVNPSEYPHRVKFESDPASPRDSDNEKPLNPLPAWSGFTMLWHRLGLPGLEGRYIELREWFRDNNMRLFHRLHNKMKGSDWFQPYEGVRYKTGTFWQDGGEEFGQSFSFVIYPGRAEGIAGEDIMIVDSLEPGHIEEYKKAKAVIARIGGRLSHGSILLREIKKPSAVITDVKNDIEGKRIAYDNGRITILE
jgi:pimeloyl-ACP methyl ester carboxylesterase